MSRKHTETDKKTNTNKKLNKKKHTDSVPRKILSIFGAVFCGLLIPVVFINCVLLIESVIAPNRVPGFLGAVPMIVVTDSMSPEIGAGDMIITRRIPVDEVKKGDIIAFFDPSASDEQKITTHRVADIIINPSGTRSFVTRGDNNNTNDNTAVNGDRVIGIFKWKVKGLGRIAMYMRTLPGFIICVLMPLLLLVMYDMIRQRVYEKRRNLQTGQLLKEIEILRAGKR